MVFFISLIFDKIIVELLLPGFDIIKFDPHFGGEAFSIDLDEPLVISFFKEAMRSE